MKIKIKPIKNLIVRDPITKQPLPNKGIYVELNSYWSRRLKDQDVILIRRRTK